MTQAIISMISLSSAAAPWDVTTSGSCRGPSSAVGLSGVTSTSCLAFCAGRPPASSTGSPCEGSQAAFGGRRDGDRDSALEAASGCAAGSQPPGSALLPERPLEALLPPPLGRR